MQVTRLWIGGSISYCCLGRPHFKALISIFDVWNRVSFLFATCFHLFLTPGCIFSFFSPLSVVKSRKNKRNATIGRGVAWLGPIAWMVPSLWLKPTTRTLRSRGRSWWWGSGRPQQMIQAWRYLWISYDFIWINVTLSIPDWIQVWFEAFKIGIWFRYFDWFDQKVSTKTMSTHR